MRYELNKEIVLYGSKKDVEKAKNLLMNITYDNESDARLKIQKIIDDENLNANMSFKGNSIWSKKKIIRNLKQIIKAGTLYRKDKPEYFPIDSMLRMPAGGKPLLTKYFYKFLNLSCGSIAHYNIRGWIAEYPTVEDLRKFFLRNEFGKRVLDSTPVWKTDAKKIVEEIEQLLGIQDQ